MERKITLKQWIENYNNGLYNSKDFNIMCKAGWYDWFCSDKSLLGKLQKLAPKVKRIAKSPKINQDTMYVFFKNNCPCVGKLYDDFRICDIETGKVIYTIVPKSGFTKNYGESEVWGKENNFEKELVKGTWEDVLNFFGVNNKKGGKL